VGLERCVSNSLISAPAEKALSPAPRSIVLLGPQRLTPTLGVAVAAAGIDVQAPGGPPLATITAGWQEREDDDRDLAEHMAERVVNLRLYARAEDVFASDPELAEAHRERGRRLQVIQAHYELRLGYAMDALYELIGRAGFDHPEVADSFEYVRALDARVLVNNAEVLADYETRWRPGERDGVARHRADVARLMAGCCGLAIAGGYVPILLNRMRLFASPDVLTAAERVFATAMEISFAEHRALKDYSQDMLRSRMEPLITFGETCRRELDGIV